MRRPGICFALKWRVVSVELPFCFFFFLAVAAHGFWAPDHERLENLDRRRPETPTREQADAVPQVQHTVPGIRVDFDPILASPSFIASPHGFLTGSNGLGLAVTKPSLDAIPAGDRDAATKAFLNEHAALFGHGAEVLATERRAREFVTPHNGLRTVIWEQALGGIPVFQGLLIAHTTQRGELVSISSRFVSDVRKAADAGMPGWLQIQASPPITAEEAIARAAASVGETMTAAEAKSAGAGSDQRLRYHAPVLLGDTEARQIWLPVSRNSLRLCWEVVLTSRKRSEMFRLVVDAETGELLMRHGLTEYYSDATYRVYTSDSPSPFSPGCSTPCTTQPPLVARDLVTLSALSSNDSPAGWISDGQNTTIGNNVDAHLDKNADDVPDPGSQPTGSPFRVFDFSMDLTQQPVTYTNAVVVQLFYWCNWMHDKLYELGFTEAAGNFQTDNFGRGGLGNDAVQADGQDGSGYNNANFSTPPDGSPGRMQMYIFNYPTPNRDGDLDAEVILHEYTHGLSNRRVGGGVGISALQSMGMGEGWSDFYALSLLSQTNDDPTATYANGGYVTYQLSGLTQNYYFGIRRYPYSTDMTKNPLTFKDIDPAQASAHTGVPRSPIIGNTANEVHNMGEVWCVTLWEARANLIAKYGPAVGNQLMLQLVTDGMNLSPANPNFLQARDAIIQADQVDAGGANRTQLWAAFAKRGMGFSATSPASSTTTGLVEAYDLPDFLKVTPTTGLNSAGSIGGPFSPASQTYAISNTGTTALNWTAGKTAGWLDISGTSGSLSPGASNTVVVTINAAANSLPAGAYSDVVTFSNVTSGMVQTRAVALNVSPPHVYYFPLDTDPGWTRQGQWTFGKPSGLGGTSHGHPDPTSGATGTNVFGVNLSGDYSTAISGPYYLTVGPLNFTGYTGTKLQFQRWLNTDYPPYVYATIDVSKDGANWTRIFTNSSGVEIADSSWTKYQYDISAVADNAATVYVRWGYQVASSGAFAYSGWNIDDVEFLGTTPNQLSVSVPSTATEGDPPTNGVVSVTPVPGTNLIVNLASSDTTEATVPATVTILAGQTNATFTLTIIDDTELDGPQKATVTASAPGFTSGSASITVNDNETATLSVSLPAMTIEGAGTVTGQVFVDATPSANVTVTLSSSDTTELIVPTSVAVTAGQTSAVFVATVVDDTVIDGPQNATVTAHVAGWTDGSTTITVLDNENYNLTVVLPAQIAEADGVITNGGSVSISGTLSSNLVVSLASSDTTELIVPASATIVAGQTSAAFNLTAIDDGVTDGPQLVTVTASAGGFTNGTATVTVLDSDVHHFVFASISSPQMVSAPFAVTITAKDATNGTVIGFRGPVALSAAGSKGSVSITPINSGTFAAGQWTGNVTVGTLDSNVVLTASDGKGHSGASNPFDMTRTVGSFFIPASGRVDMVHDALRGLLYITAGNQVLRYSLNGGTFLTPFAFGSSLMGIDLSPDGNTLAVADNASANGSNWVYLVDLPTGTNAQVMFPQASAGTYAVAFGSDGAVLISSRFSGSGWVPLWRYDPVTKTATTVANPRQDSMVSASGDGRIMAVVEANISSGPLDRYNVSSQTFSGTVDTGWFTFEGAANRDGTQFGVPTYGGTFIYDSNLTQVAKLGTYASEGPIGLAYHPQSDLLFVAWWPTSYVRAYDTHTFAQVAQYNCQYSFGWVGNVAFQQGRIRTSRDGNDVFVTVGGGVEWIARPSGPPADLALTQSGSPNPVNVGSNLTYSAVVTNRGPNGATGVVVSETLPANTVFVSASSSQGTCSQANGIVTCAAGTVGNGGTMTVTIVVTPTQAGTLLATASVTSDAQDPSLTNNVVSTLTSVAFISSPDSVNILNLTTKDLAYDPVGQRIYASIPSSVGGTLGNSVLALDPVSGLASNPVFVGSEPGKLAISGDGHYLYVSLDGAGAVRRVDLPTQTAGLQFSTGVSDMQVVPGNANAVAVCNGGFSGAVVIYDNGVPRPVTPPYYNQINVIEFGSSASALYGYDNTDTGFGFTRMVVDSNGVSVVDSTGGLISGFGVDMRFDGGKIFATSGTVVNPTNRTVVGSIPVSGPVCPNVSIGRVFYLSGSTLHAFDPNTFVEVGSITISGVSGTASSLIRCGADRLAFRTTGGQIFVVRTSLIPTQPPADLQVTQVGSPNPVNVGSNLTYSIVITNNGPNAATNVLVSQTLPATVTFVSAISSQGTCTQSGGTVTAALGTLGNGAAATVTVVVKPTQAGLLQATTSVTSSAVDPNGTNNVVTTLTTVGFIALPDSVNILNVTTKDLAYDPVGQRIYASIPSSVGGGLGNSVLAIDPASGLASNPVFVGSEPGKLAIADNGHYGYVSLDGAGAVRRVDLTTQTADLQFSLGGYYVEDMEAVPGNAHAVAISRKNTCCSPRHEGVAVYDDGVQRPNATPGFQGSNVIEFGPGSSVLYGYNNETSEFGFYTMIVDASGVMISSDVGGLLGGYGVDIKYDGGLIYATSGTVIDPSNRVVVGSYPVSGFVRPDAKIDRVFYLSGTTLWSFEPNTRAPLGSLTISNISGSAGSLIRWGTDGLALRTDSGQVCVIRTSLIPTGSPADLAVTQLDSPDPVNAGNNLTYTVTASNNGPNGVSDAWFFDRLPAGVNFVSATSSQGACTLSNDLVSCALGALSSGGTATISITVTPPIQAVLANTAAITSSAKDPNVTNNSATIFTTVLGTASLVVTPATNLVATGINGGPFNPSSQTYTLTNSGTAALNWSVTNTASWVSLSATSGTLLPFTTTTITVSINAGANSLPAGSYNDTVSFVNLNNGIGNTTRGVSLTITPMGILSITPSTGLDSSGYIGGPFSPASQLYSLTNTGYAALSWSASKSQGWLTLSATSGTLGAGDVATVTASINSSANALPAGYYSDTIAFTNLTSGIGSDIRGVSLNVRPPLDHFSFSTIATQQPAAVPIAVTITAINSTNGVSTEFTGSVALSATSSNGAVPVLPANSGAFSDGQWAGTVTISNLATNVRLIAADGAGHSGTSTAFNVVIGPVDHFALSPVAATQYVANPFPLTITAQDAGNYTVVNFTNSVALICQSGTTQSSQLITFDDLPYSGGVPLPTDYAGITWSNVYYMDRAAYGTNSGYYAGTVSLPNVAFDGFAQTAGISSTNSFSLISAYLTAAWMDNLQLQVTAYAGPALAYSNAYTLSTTTPKLINFDYYGVTRVELVYGGGGGNTHFAIDNILLSTNGTTSIAISPTNTGNFVGGVWSGSVMGLQAASNVFLQANDGAGHIGNSSQFVILGPVLAVSPGSGFTSSGFLGGPFIPPSQTYMVTNSGTANLNWSVTNTASWLTLSTTGGTLPAGAGTNVTVTINGNATNLTVGSYADAVTFTNLSNGAGSTLRSVSLTISLSPWQQWQMQHFGCINCPQAAATADPDGDGQSNAAEFLAGTDPTSSVSMFRIISIVRTGDDIRVTWQTGGGCTNILQSMSSPGGVYFNISPAIAIPNAGDAVTNYLDKGGATNGPCRFYRVAVGAGSMQDTTPPSLTVVSPTDNTYTTNATVTVTGTSSDASGVAGVTINGVAVSSDNGYSNWTAVVSGLSVGTNTLTVLAADNAAPANIATNVIQVIYAADDYDGNGDGLPDAWQINWFGSVNAPGRGPNDDPDGDGASNLKEYLAGTDPTNSSSFLRITAVEKIGGDIRISFTSVIGKGYRLEQCNVIGEAWTNIVDNIAGNNGIQQATDIGGATRMSSFYRVSVETNSPAQLDSDGDGIPDDWMEQYFGHPMGEAFDQSRAADDPDGDGMSNLEEYLTGTDPTDNASAFRIIGLAVNGIDVLVTWTMGSGKTNALQRTAGNASGGYNTSNFTDIFIVTNTVGAVTNYLDAGAVTNLPSRFYRVRLVP
jgi:uncharacterized repeat protein (TIGR01451 family)